MKRIALGLALVAALSVAALFTASAGRAAVPAAHFPNGFHRGTPGKSYQ